MPHQAVQRLDRLVRAAPCVHRSAVPSRALPLHRRRVLHVALQPALVRAPWPQRAGLPWTCRSEAVAVAGARRLQGGGVEEGVWGREAEAEDEGLDAGEWR